MSVIKISTAFNIDLEFEIAPFHKRLLAYCIDLGILVVYLFSIKFVLYNGFDIGLHDYIGLDILVVSMPMLLYSLLMELWMNGQTIGKKLMALRVISLDGGEPTFGQYLLRWITRMFEWPFFFGYIIGSQEMLVAYLIVTGIMGIGVVIPIVVTAKGQRLGDLAAGTVIVQTKSTMSIEDTVFMETPTSNYVPLFPEVMRLSDGDINTIKSVITQTMKTKNEDMCRRVEYKVKDVLGIRSDLPSLAFLEKLLEDYNYFATRE